MQTPSQSNLCGRAGSPPRMLSGNVQVQAIFILVVVLGVALVTVVNLMQGDFSNLLIGLSAVGIAAYLGKLWNYSWVGAVFVGMLGFAIAPTGFWIPADFMCCGFALGMAVSLLLRRALGAPAAPPVATPGLNPAPMMFLLILYLVYLLVQGMFGEVSPVYAGQYNVKNTVKAYAEDAFPALTLVLLIVMRYRLPSLSEIVKWVTPAMLLAVLALCAYRFYQVLQGHYEADATTDYFGVIIPGINLIPSEFALRIACPVAAIWAASQIFSPDVRLRKIMLAMNVLLVLLTLAGAVLSAGRAVPFLVLFGVCSMAFLARRFGFLFVGMAAFVLFVTVVNVAGPVIDRLPYAVRRSVALLRFEDTAAKESISGSTGMRKFLIDEGVKELKSDSRILLTGRGVLQFTRGDGTINSTQGLTYEKWMLAVRTGRLHCTLANQLIRYGLIGAIFYYAAQVGILLYCWKAYRLCRSRRLPAMSLAAFSLAIMMMNTFVGFVQDAPFTSLTAWLIALHVGVATKQGVPLSAAFPARAFAPARQRPAQVPAGMIGRQG